MLRRILLAGFMCAFVVSLAGAQGDKTPPPVEKQPAEKPPAEKQPAPPPAPAKGKVVVLIETSMGNIKIGALSGEGSEDGR